ncbi:thiol reductase thioredoxin [Paenibacillus sp. J31TS4]|uniref:thioredoxin family protein n=1 Tax=Paenibacillus sp. J31TS4 TaxID=2807195 RepID=UPI001B269688|nr:thioredoxin family protein [Paenibacillus sp. J31TS4]GIP37283.1 thiol reductase thioredoxin [Paenibacillus sp. J31TS4]
MKQVTEEELFGWAERHGDRAGVFLYTPLCGTCKVAERMLGVVERMLPDLPLFACDVNYAPRLVESWQVRSVPGLAVIQDGKLLRVRYAMGGADELYAFLAEDAGQSE